MTSEDKRISLNSEGFARNSSVLYGAVVLVLILILWRFWHWKHANRETIPLPSSQASTPAPLYEPHDKPMAIVLKGVDLATGKFVGARMVIHQSKSRYNQMKQAVLAYLHGPREGKFQVPVPRGMELNQFFFTTDGIAVVDLSLGGVKRESFGYYEEVLFVRGMIETLTGNFFEVRRVKLLVDGQDAPVLGGHYALGTSEANMPVSLPSTRSRPTLSAP